ncbi:MAG: alpha/beta hydrolase [Chthoniobacterales bacterium]|nr:alpha/beta hydrolase [Chthoniobacterales bacterium]
MHALLLRPLIHVAMSTAVACVMIGCEQKDSARRVGPEEGFVRVAENVDLHYRDWGGDGPPIVLLSGLGNTAAIFDDLAPQLTNAHRVIGLTRRGYGGSTVTAEGYDVASRVADDAAAMQALGIRRALLVGHSIAGDELTGIVQARPDLVAGLVYLDAAFDRTDQAADATFAGVVPLLPQPEEVVRFSSDEAEVASGELKLKSFAAARRLIEAEQGAPVPASELRAQLSVDRNGVYHFKDTSAQERAIRTGSSRVKADYRGIVVPVTALYADWGDPAAAFPITALAGAEARETLRHHATKMATWAEQAGLKQVRSQVPAIVEVVPGAPHYIFLKEPALVSRHILETAARAAWQNNLDATPQEAGTETSRGQGQ